MSIISALVLVLMTCAATTASAFAGGNSGPYKFSRASFFGKPFACSESPVVNSSVISSQKNALFTVDFIPYGFNPTVFGTVYGTGGHGTEGILAKCDLWARIYLYPGSVEDGWGTMSIHMHAWPACTNFFLPPTARFAVTKAVNPNGPPSGGNVSRIESFVLSGVNHNFVMSVDCERQ